jgi:hypothetical protein
MARRSTLPDVPDLDPNLAKFLEGLDKRRLTPVAEITALTAASTTADIVVAIQALATEMRLRGAMEE